MKNLSGNQGRAPATSAYTVLPTFDPVDHAYLLDSRRIPSVTQIMRDAGIIDTSLYERYPEATERGTAVHKDIALLLEASSLGIALLPAPDPVAAPFVDAFRSFLSVSNFSPLLWEQTVYSATHGYAGRFDLYGVLHGRAAFIEIKTGKLPAWTNVQLTAYKVAAIECRLHAAMSTARLFGLELRADGLFSLSEPLAEDFGTFQQALAARKKNSHV